MSRPLELDVWQSATCREAGCECAMGRECPGWLNPRTGQWIEEGCEPHKPRLTDAELAAEYWKASERVRSCAHPALKVQRANALAKLQTLHRFAIHPHYDEVDQ